MNSMGKTLVAGAVAFTVSLGLSFTAPNAYAAGDAAHAPEHHWSFSGLFGTYDWLIFG